MNIAEIKNFTNNLNYIQILTIKYLMNGKANKLPEKKPNIGFWKEYAYKRTCTAVFLQFTKVE